MARQCPLPGRCGTKAPVWLRDPHGAASNMTSGSSVADMEACVSWSFDQDGEGDGSNFDCCLFTLPVTVKRCPGDFHVYYLGPTQVHITRIAILQLSITFKKEILKFIVTL